MCRRRAACCFIFLLIITFQGYSLVIYFCYRHCTILYGSFKNNHVLTKLKKNGRQCHYSFTTRKNMFPMFHCTVNNIWKRNSSIMVKIVPTRYNIEKTWLQLLYVQYPKTEDEALETTEYNKDKKIWTATSLSVSFLGLPKLMEVAETSQCIGRQCGTIWVQTYSSSCSLSTSPGKSFHSHLYKSTTILPSTSSHFQRVERASWNTPIH